MSLFGCTDYFSEHNLTVYDCCELWAFVYNNGISQRKQKQTKKTDNILYEFIKNSVTD